MNTCLDCGAKGKNMHLEPDPRTPPLEEGSCLCDDCLEAALGGLVEETEALLAGYECQLMALERKKRARKKKRK